MGPQFVSKAVTLVWNNLGAAIRATVLPFGLMVLIPGMLLTAALPEPPSLDAPSAVAPSASLPLLLLAAVIALLLFAWAAVAWHRYVLIEETPRPLALPEAGAVTAYAWAMIRVGLIAVAVLLAVGLAGLLVGAGLAGALGDGALLPVVALGFGASVLFSYALLRFSMVLPSAAVGRPMSLRESWRATHPARNAVLVAALLLGVLQYMLQLVGAALLLAGLPGFLLSLLVTWASAMIGLSILTALYGVLVEGRPVD